MKLSLFLVMSFLIFTFQNHIKCFPNAPIVYTFVSKTLSASGNSTFDGTITVQCINYVGKDKTKFLFKITFDPVQLIVDGKRQFLTKEFSKASFFEQSINGRIDVIRVPKELPWVTAIKKSIIRA